MSDQFSIDGVPYQTDSLTEAGKRILKHLQFTVTKLQGLNAEKAFLNRAKNGYISDLKTEIAEAKSGIDFSTFFEDD